MCREGENEIMNDFDEMITPQFIARDYAQSRDIVVESVGLFPGCIV